MAITKILTINDCGRMFAAKHLKQAISYIIDEAKTQGGRYVTGVNCQPELACEQMIKTKRKYGKMDKRQGYHMIISFEEENLEPSIAFEIVGRFVDEFLGEGFEAIYAVHDNTEHTHGHIIYNSVNYLTGKKFRYEKGDWARVIQPITNRLCEEYGLSTIDIEMEGLDKQKRYQDWNEFRDGKFIWRDMIRRDVDACIMQSDTFEEFLDMLKEKGYEIKQNQYLAIKPQGMSRFCRCKSLGEHYTEERIRVRIQEETIETYKGYKVEIPKDEFLPRTKLSGIQKIYYKKVCRVRGWKQLPYSKAWQYRDDIRKLERLQEQYLFLVKNDVHSLDDLIAVTETLAGKAKECRSERRAIKKEQERFEDLFGIADRMQELQYSENSFQSGDDFFEPEHKEYEELNGKLAKEGYTLEEIRLLRERYQDRLGGNYEKRNAVNHNLKLAKDMIDEVAVELERVQTEKQVDMADKKQEQPRK